MNGVAVAVCQNLHFDMARVYDALFQKHVSAAKRFGRFGNNPFEILPQRRFVITTADTAAATTGCCLEHHRIAHGFSLLDRILDIFEVTVGARGNRDTRVNCGLTRVSLVTH